MSAGAHEFSPEELQRLLAADRLGEAYISLRDAGGALHVQTLRGGRLAIGRAAGSDVALEWDQEVSRLHAELELIGVTWVLCDDGLSSNGTYVNSERLHGRRTLRDGDVVRVGSTVMRFRAPRDEVIATARASTGPIEISDAQRRVLVELCRPLAGGGPSAPASNQEIADALYLGVESVRSHMKALFERFDVGDLPQNRKRARLAELAVESGTVRPGAS